VWHYHVFLFDDLRGELTQSIVLSLESSGAFWRASVHAEHDVLVLIRLGEGVEDSVTLLISVRIDDVASLASPAHLRNLIVEETILEAASPVLEAEPLERVWLLTLTSELFGSPFGLKIKHGVVPGLAGVCIDVPAVFVLILSPVGYAETLEDGPGTSVEGHVTDALKQSVWVEVLGVNVMHDVRLLVELVAVYILDTKSCLSSLLDVEPVSDEEEVGVDEAHRLANVLLQSRAGVKAELDPALVSLMSNVVLQWSSDLALACKGTVDESIQ